MITAFFRILNMSLTACVLIPVVIVQRIVLKKAPKWISCLLWALVAVRLLCPFSIESVLSLIPSAEPVPEEIMTEAHPEIHTGVSFVNRAVNPVLSEFFTPSVGDSVNPLQVYSYAAAVIWVCGMVILLFYALVSYLLLHRKVRASVLWKENIKLCDDIQTPFILGVFRPRIYIPSGLDEVQMNHVILHENAHMRRLDHLWKLLGYLALMIHWFNPLVWIAYVLLCRDIELACDEKVIQKLPPEETRAYSASLLSCSVSMRNILVCPLAFGEVGVRERVAHVLHYKKPGGWIAAAAVLVCGIVAICFLTNPKEDGNTAGTEGIGDGIISEKPTDGIPASETDALSQESPEQQSQSAMPPDAAQYENLSVDYVEQDGKYIVGGDRVFQYKKVLKDRDPNAVKAIVFVVLTNNQDITWEQVFRSIFSSNSNDWLQDTVIIGMEAVDD